MNGTYYFAKEGTRIKSSVHGLEDGLALCGYTPSFTMKPMFCSPRIVMSYIDCEKCRSIITKRLDDDRKEREMKKLKEENDKAEKTILLEDLTSEERESILLFLDSMGISDKVK